MITAGLGALIVPTPDCCICICTCPDPEVKGWRMLDFLVQLIAAFGPIILAIMGVVVSIRPPPPTGTAHWVWAAVFIAVGALTAISLFRELRGTDELLVQIWGKVNDNAELLGPKIEFAGIEAKEVDGAFFPIIHVSNTSDIEATGYLLTGSIVITEDDNNDIEKAIKSAKDFLIRNPVQASGSLPLTRGMGAELPLPKIDLKYVDMINDGKRRAYVLFLASYVNNKTPADHVWVTEVCAKIIKLFSKFQSCPAHNGFFYTDRSLSDIH